MHKDHEKFIHAIEENRKVLLTYLGNESDRNVKCIPVDYGLPSKVHRHKCYYFWDPEAEIGKRLLAIPVWKVMIMELADEIFDPMNFIVPEKY